MAPQTGYLVFSVGTEPLPRQSEEKEKPKPKRRALLGAFLARQQRNLNEDPLEGAVSLEIPVYHPPLPFVSVHRPPSDELPPTGLWGQTRKNQNPNFHQDEHLVGGTIVRRGSLGFGVGTSRLPRRGSLGQASAGSGAIRSARRRPVVAYIP